VGDAQGVQHVQQPTPQPGAPLAGDALATIIDRSSPINSSSDEEDDTITEYFQWKARLTKKQSIKDKIEGFNSLLKNRCGEFVTSS